MLYRQWTKNYEDLQNQRYEKEKERLQLVKELDEIDKKLKEEEKVMDEEVKRQYRDLYLTAQSVEVIWWVYIKRDEDWVSNVIFRNNLWMLVEYLPMEWDLYEFSENKCYCYHIRTYEDALDWIKELSYGRDTFIRRLRKEAIDDCYENCSLEEFMEHFDLSQVDDFYDLKEDVTEPDDSTLEKLYELEQDWENIFYNAELNYFEREKIEDLDSNEE